MVLPMPCVGAHSGKPRRTRTDSLFWPGWLLDKPGRRDLSRVLVAAWNWSTTWWCVYGNGRRPADADLPVHWSVASAVLIRYTIKLTWDTKPAEFGTKKTEEKKPVVNIKFRQCCAIPPPPLGPKGVPTSPHLVSQQIELIGFELNALIVLSRCIYFMQRYVCT